MIPLNRNSSCVPRVQPECQSRTHKKRSDTTYLYDDVQIRRQPLIDMGTGYMLTVSGANTEGDPCSGTTMPFQGSCRRDGSSGLGRHLRRSRRLGRRGGRP